MTHQSLNLSVHLLSQCRVLIVDDSKTNRSILKKFCKSAGFLCIQEACDGQEALDKILENKPDIVFLDMYMPHLNGIEVCVSLQRLNQINNMVIMMQSSVDDPEFKAQAFNSGVTDFVNKPLHEREVMSRALAHLERLFLHRQMEVNYDRIQAELKEASLIQNVLLPQNSFLESIRKKNKLDIACHYRSASELAGDYISVRELNDHQIALLSVDVAGHGVSAALYAFCVHTLLDDKRMSCESPGRILEMLNQQFLLLMSRGKFLTLFLGVIDTHEKTLSYASAAAPPPLLIAKEKPTFLPSAGFLLGVKEGVSYDTHQINFAPEDVLCLYSDALIETPNAKGHFMKEEEISKILIQSQQDDAHEQIEQLSAHFYRHYSSTPQDDLSLLICRYL